MTVSLHNRRKLERAIARLLEGTVTPPGGKLTWKNVAVVAGVSKATADRAVDLRDEFHRQVDQRMPRQAARPQAGPRPRSDIDEEISHLREENAELKQSSKILHSVILALVKENERLARHRPRDQADERKDNSRHEPALEPLEPVLHPVPSPRS